MTNDEKNVVLDVLNDASLFNKMALEGAATLVLPKNCTWSAASDGKLSLAADVEFDFVSAGDTVYGLSVYASSISLGASRSSFIYLGFNPSITFAQYDIYTVEDLSITINN